MQQSFQCFASFSAAPHAAATAQNLQTQPLKLLLTQQQTNPQHTTPAATDARTTDGMNTAEPGTDSPAGTDAPDSEKPTEDGSGQIADFREGKVVKPEDVPEIRSAVEKEYPGYTIQSVTHALLSDRQAYKVTLQGSGDLAKVIYMLADGTIVVPKMQD